MAPGDTHTVHTYPFTYTGTVPATVSVTTSTSGDLTTCSGGGMFAVTITDDQANVYADNAAGQPVRIVQPGEELTFTAVGSLSIAAGNDCQGKTALVTVQPVAVQLIPDPQPEDNDPTPPSTDTTPPVTTQSEPQFEGTFTVRVLDGSPRNDGDLVPIVGAAVTLSDGQTGITGADGQITFTDLSAGSYEAAATATDPLNPTGIDLRTGTAGAAVNAENPNATVTVVLAWEPVDAAPPVPSVTRGSITVRALDGSERHGGNHAPLANAAVVLTPGRTGVTDANGHIAFDDLAFGTYQVTVLAYDPQRPSASPRQGGGLVTISATSAHETLNVVLVWEPASGQAPAPTGATPSAPVGVTPSAPAPGTITGRICAPSAPGAEIVAAGPEGLSASVRMAFDGTVGVWRSYTLPNLSPGVWVVTLNSDDGRAISQTLTVLSDVTVDAANFSLACTGGAFSIWTALGVAVGVMMLLAGLLLRFFARRERLA